MYRLLPSFIIVLSLTGIECKYILMTYDTCCEKGMSSTEKDNAIVDQVNISDYRNGIQNLNFISVTDILTV